MLDSTPRRDGFHHKGRIIYSVRYRLETPPPRSRDLIVPLDCDGNAVGNVAVHSDPSKRIVNAKVGDVIIWQGIRETVVEVNVESATREPLNISQWDGRP